MKMLLTFLKSFGMPLCFLAMYLLGAFFFMGICFFPQWKLSLPPDAGFYLHLVAFLLCFGVLLLMALFVFTTLMVLWLGMVMLYGYLSTQQEEKKSTGSLVVCIIALAFIPSWVVTFAKAFIVALFSKEGASMLFLLGEVGSAFVVYFLSLLLFFVYQTLREEVGKSHPSFKV